MGFSKLFCGMFLLEIVLENIKVVEWGKYEDVKVGEIVCFWYMLVVSFGFFVFRFILYEVFKV